MTGFTIIIGAKNLVGGAVDGVKRQLKGLNNSIGKIRFAIRGLTIGVGAMVLGARSLIQESTRTDELEKAFANVQSKWAHVKSTIGDGLVEIFSKMARPFEWLVDGIQTAINKMQQLGAAVTYFVANMADAKGHGGFGDLWKESWAVGNDVVAEMRAEEEDRRGKAAAAAAAKAAEKAKLEAARVERENVLKELEKARAEAAAAAEKAAMDAADDKGKLHLLHRKQARMEDQHWEKMADLEAQMEDGSLTSSDVADRQELEVLNYQKQQRELAREIAEIEERIATSKQKQAEEEAKATALAKQKREIAAIQEQYARTEGSYKSAVAKMDEKIGKLKEGIRADEEATKAGEEAAETHRERGMNYRAARAADKAAAREERRWQNRVKRANYLASKGGEANLPGWAKEVLASEKASQAAKNAEVAAKAKREELDNLERQKAQTLENMKSDLNEIKSDLKECLRPA